LVFDEPISLAPLRATHEHAIEQVGTCRQVFAGAHVYANFFFFFSKTSPVPLALSQLRRSLLDMPKGPTFEASSLRPCA
jgi:hypothetical protein